MMFERLSRNHDVTDNELSALLETAEYDELLFQAADKVRREVYGTDVYIRGLIEISS